MCSSLTVLVMCSTPLSCSRDVQQSGGSRDVLHTPLSCRDVQQSGGSRDVQHTSLSSRDVQQSGGSRDAGELQKNEGLLLLLM